jgi:hypothetical protein
MGTERASVRERVSAEPGQAPQDQSPCEVKRCLIFRTHGAMDRLYRVRVKYTMIKVSHTDLIRADTRLILSASAMTALRRTIRLSSLAGLVGVWIISSALLSARVSAQTPAPTAPAAPAASAPANGPGDYSQTTVTPAPQPSAQSHHFYFTIGPQVGVFLPTDSKTRNRFGSSWLSVGIGIGPVVPASRRGALEVDLQLLSQTGSDRHVYIAPLGLQYRQALTGSGPNVPYVGASADAIFADIRSPQDNAHSGLREGVGGSAFVGTTFGTNAYVEARYLVTSTIESFNLSGLEFTVGARF